MRLTWEGHRSLIALFALLLTLALGVAACGDDDDSSGGGGGGGGSSAAEEPAAEASKCGLGNGEKASGEPIKLGAIITKQPGVDFTDISDMSKAYFDCVNDNGGINGRPVQYVVQTEQTNPQQVASLATKLLENDKVVGFVGSTSLLDCDVNDKLYRERDIYPIVAGVPKACFTTPNIAAVNMGPHYSTLGAAQYLERAGAKSIVSVANKQPGAEWNNQGASEYAKSKGLPSKEFLEVVPITDGAALALKLVEAAGDGGGVILDFIPPEALKVLQGAEQQGLIDKVKWACATPCNDASIAQALGPAWDGKLGVNAELNLTTATGADSQLYRNVLKQYAPKVPLGSFSQMGFLEARIAVDALLKMKGDFTAESVNAAFKGVKGFKTDILCKPWYYGGGSIHIPNNTDRTTTPQGGKMVQKEDCFPISDVDPAIAQVRKLESGASGA